MANINTSDCTHIINTELDIPGTTCDECGVTSPTRVCLSCGHIGCCETTNGHALAHSRASGHPVIRELPISERSFTWCYGCNAYLK
ncbi:MAG TPA: UBP-type zinc finger domain-containing protein [Blastocatellia bacterium]|nr:UBP-type zinc finger domain-containing protein [Blastocatellia bacterium]